MKISSASKKVLASALSAAMVVAFAPTVALGKTATEPSAPVLTAGTVAITYDINGGKITDSSYSSLISETANVCTEGGKSYIKVGAAATANAGMIAKSGATFANWFVDADGDGKYDSDKEYQPSANGYLEIESGTASITLKASYNEPVFTTDGIIVDTTATAGHKAAIDADVVVTNLTAGAYYTASLVNPAGTVIAASSPVAAASNKTLTISDLAATDAYDETKLAKGDYVLKIVKTDGTVAATKTFPVVELTLAAGTYGTFDSSAVRTVLVSKGTTFGSLTGTLSAPNSDGGYTASGWAIDGVAVTDGTEFKKDATLTATYNNPKVETPVATVDNYEKKTGKIHVEADDNLVALTNGYYKVTLSGPDGLSKVITETAAGTKVTKSTLTAGFDVTFGAAYENYTAVTAPLAAGTYTVAVEAYADTENKKTLTEAEKAPVASASVTLAAVSYDLGAGEWKTTGKKQPSTLPTLLTAGTSISTVKDALTGALTATNIKAPALQSVDTANITIDGVKVGKIDAETVAASGVSVVVAYKTAYIATPEVAFAATSTGYVATVTAATGVTVTYNVNNTGNKALGSDGKITLAAGDTVVINSVNAAGTESEPATYVGCGTAASGKVADIADFATGIANGTTSTSVANKPVRYGDTLTTLKDDAVAAVKAIGFATDTAWNEAMVAQKQAILEKAAAIELANIEAAKALVKGIDGKYSYVADVDAAKATAAVAQLMADFKGLTDYALGKTSTQYTPKSKYDATHYVDVNTSGANYAKAMKLAATATRTTVAADVAEPAIAVSNQLTASKTAAEAQAAIEAYNKLTAAQKALVSAADVAAAEAIVAQQALVDAQDEGALNKINSTKKLTVKLNGASKTKKAASVTYTTKVSKSGNTVVYAKKSGSSKITVAKSGKVTLKKGVKKGTYTAKVKATCGTQTRTVTAKFIVK